MPDDAMLERAREFAISDIGQARLVAVFRDIRREALEERAIALETRAEESRVRFQTDFCRGGRWAMSDEADFCRGGLWAMSDEARKIRAVIEKEKVL